MYSLEFAVGNLSSIGPYPTWPLNCHRAMNGLDWTNFELDLILKQFLRWRGLLETSLTLASTNVAVEKRGLWIDQIDAT